MTRPYDELYALRMRDAHRFPMTEALCRCFDDPNNNLRATLLGQLDRARLRGEATISGDAIPSIFAEAPRQPPKAPLVPIADEEPTLLMWGAR